MKSLVYAYINRVTDLRLNHPFHPLRLTWAYLAISTLVYKDIPNTQLFPPLWLLEHT